MKQKLFNPKIKNNNAEIPLDILIAIIVLIICIFSYYYYQKNETLKKQYTRAKQDCDTYIQAIQKFNSLEGTIVKDLYMKELRGAYITGDYIIDPWKRRFKHDYNKRIVYSSGPNGIDFDDDDIVVKY